MKFLPGLIVSALLISGCASDVVYSGFIPAEDAKDGLYSFVVKIDSPRDSLNVNLLSRNDKSAGTGMIVRWYGPDGNLYLVDTLDAVSGLCQYRTGVVLDMEGNWGVEVQAGCGGTLRGVGLEMKRYGTR